MGKDKPCLLDIPKAYRTKTIDQWMFAFCQGVQRIAPSCTDSDAISAFMHWADLDEDQFAKDVAATKYTQMKKDFLFC